MKVYYMFYFWGYSSAFISYSLLSYFFPSPETMVEATIYEDSEIVSAASINDDKGDSDILDEKKLTEFKSEEV